MILHIKRIEGVASNFKANFLSMLLCRLNIIYSRKTKPNKLTPAHRLHGISIENRRIPNKRPAVSVSSAEVPESTEAGVSDPMIPAESPQRFAVEYAVPHGSSSHDVCPDRNLTA